MATAKTKSREQLEADAKKRGGRGAVAGKANVAAAAEGKGTKGTAGWPKKLPSGAAFPASMGALADAFYTKRHERLALQKKQEAELDAVKADENALREFIINEVPKSDQGGLLGAIAKAEIVKKDAYKAADWHKVYGKIVALWNEHLKKKTGQEDAAFALLQKRLGDGAVKEMWEAGQTVPGVEKYQVIDVSITKR